METFRTDSDSDPPSCCSSSSSSSSFPFSDIQLYQAFIFSVPVFFVFLLLFLFYLFYLRSCSSSRRRRTDWSPTTLNLNENGNPRMMHPHRESQMGLKKELREMLPIVVYKETFSINDTQCSVCLGDYQVEDRLQQIPACGHTFHAECIDNWLANHTTCPLCRLSLLASSKTSSEA